MNFISFAVGYVTLRDLQRDIASRLRVVFRHYALSGIHHHAQQAAEAAEVAGAQGKFWEMHTLLFERQEALHTKDLILYAGKLNLDVEPYEPDGPYESTAHPIEAHAQRDGRRNRTCRSPFSLSLNTRSTEARGACFCS
jgi:protein-disulfide isomerase